MTEPTFRRTPGRPRDETTHQAVLDATVDILLDQGYRALTVEGIARRCGIGKQTIYRWWPSTTAILAEAVEVRAEQLAPAPRTGDLGADLTALLGRTAELLAGPLGCVMATLMAQAQLEPAFGAAFRTTFLAQRRDVLRELITSAHPDPARVNLAVDIAFGTIWYRLQSAHAPLDDAFVRDLTEAMVSILATGRQD